MENKKRTEFEEFMDNEIEDWETKLSIEVKNNLIEAFYKYKSCEAVTTTTNSATASYIMCLIDPCYSITAVLAQLNLPKFKQQLDDLLSETKKSLGNQKKI